MRYVLHPGDVLSKFDGQVHFISGVMLVRLYGVPPEKCVYANRLGFKPLSSDVHLYPRYNGDYTLPTSRSHVGTQPEQRRTTMRYFKQRGSGLVIEISSVIAYPQGGGFRMTIPGANFREEFEPYEFPEDLPPGRVTIDGWDETFPALISYELWNGWRMPLFTFEVALQIAELLNSEGEGSRIVYNGERDCFVMSEESCPGEDYDIPARMIDGVAYYGIGAGSWCWEEARDDQNSTR